MTEKAKHPKISVYAISFKPCATVHHEGVLIRATYSHKSSRGDYAKWVLGEVEKIKSTLPPSTLIPLEEIVTNEPPPDPETISRANFKPFENNRLSKFIDALRKLEGRVHGIVVYKTDAGIGITHEIGKGYLSASEGIKEIDRKYLDEVYRQVQELRKEEPNAEIRNKIRTGIPGRIKNRGDVKKLSKKELESVIKQIEKLDQT